jgi:hypothetical protein
MLGHFVAGLVGISAGGRIGTWVISLGGAILLIVILRAVGIFKKA